MIQQADNLSLGILNIHRCGFSSLFTGKRDHAETKYL